MSQELSSFSTDTSAEAAIRIYRKLQAGLRTPYSILADYGKNWTPALKPEWVPYGTQGLCFQNAFDLAMRTELTYVEGYATGVIPTHHAWCVDFNGNVVDPTWRTLGCSYFGIPFDTDYVANTAVNTRMYSIFWNHHNRALFDLEVADFHSRNFAINCI